MDIAHSDEPIMEKIEVRGVRLVVEIHLPPLADRLVRHYTERDRLLVQQMRPLVGTVDVVEGLRVSAEEKPHRVGGNEVAVVQEGDDQVVTRHGAGDDDGVGPFERPVLEAPEPAGEADGEGEEVGVEMADEEEIGAEVVLALDVEAVDDGRVLEVSNVPFRVGRGGDGMLRKSLRNTHEAGVPISTNASERIPPSSSPA